MSQDVKIIEAVSPCEAGADKFIHELNAAFAEGYTIAGRTDGDGNIKPRSSGEWPRIGVHTKFVMVKPVVQVEPIPESEPELETTEEVEPIPKIEKAALKKKAKKKPATKK